MGIQVYKGTCPFQRGDNHRNLKMGWGNLNIFSRTTGLILTRLGKNHSRIERIQVSLKEGDSPPPRGDNSKIVKIHRIVFKKSFPEPAGQNQSNLVQIIFG